ncbi:hypothetical protein, variant [Verruconis gallopava]|uniref:Uncharacterized protein n=1 Tax=Verruconis gallopava TaxID=253628 RepID=A0A0D2AI06_9PEZI|nr:hypothetical protein, variant [Verruconis gallopava]KIV98528.1 hypothetical protein, variant [Verruconis gallopava]
MRAAQIFHQRALLGNNLNSRRTETTPARAAYQQTKLAIAHNNHNSRSTNGPRQALMDVNILDLSPLEVDERILESADKYYPTFLRISDVCRVAEGLTNPTYREDVIKQLTTVLARLPIIWAIRDTEAKLRELGTETRFGDRTCNRLKDFADYTYQTKCRQKDKYYVEKQKLLRTVNWRVFRFHSIAFSIEKTRNMNLNRLRQVLQLVEARIKSRGLGRYLNRMEFNNALAVHASRVRYGEPGLYDPSYEAFKAAQPEERVEHIPQDHQDEISPVAISDHQGMYFPSFEVLLSTH